MRPAHTYIPALRASGQAAAIGAGPTLLLLAVALLLAPASAAAQAATTRVMVRAVSHDAKIIGGGVGGARISVVDVATGETLASGVQEGGTGDTGKIVVEPRVRGESVFDTEGAAGFLAELELEAPTQVRIEAEGPLGTPHATQRATRTMLLVPGQDVLGDGVVLELYGFTVELLEPTGERAGGEGGEIEVRARVTMLCGCPTEPGGLWDSNEYTIEARILQDDHVMATAPLEFAGETSTYRGRIGVPGRDGFTLQVLAMDASRANFGLVERSFSGSADSPASR